MTIYRNKYAGIHAWKYVFFSFYVLHVRSAVVEFVCLISGIISLIFFAFLGIFKAISGNVFMK